MTPKKPVSNFLNNAPCGEDLFKGKSQTRIADCISSHIKKADAEWTEENHLGHIIGVEGGWGSGKTNVTQILKKTINRGGKKYIFFDYDLWAYQEDLKRRSILEALMHFLKDNYKCFREKEWIDREKELFAKTVESEKKTTPKFGFGLLLGISVIILIPITSMVAEIFIKDESGNNTCLAIFVTLIPALIVILFAVGAFVHFSTKWIFDKKIQTSDGWWPYVSDSMSRFFLNVYKTEAVDLKTKETISESEPSVKDFRDWMDAVSTDLEKKKVDKKLVIIFDNLDRIQDQSIQEIWSLINTFFAEKTYKNIWVIVPFDQERVRKSFKSRVNETGAAEDFCSDYVNKTFDVVYRVAPPIMTDWKNYFRQMWSKAFGKSEDEQLQAVIDVYESLRKKTTPRDINAFINSVVATRQIFPEIPLEYVAIFCGSKDAILSDPVTRILSSDYLGSIGSKYKDDKDLAKYTAALVYQVDPSQAIEVALWQELQIALEEGNSIKTKEIADSNVFFDLLSPHLNSIVGYNNAIVALSTVSASVFPDKQSERGVWNTLYTKTIKQKGYGQKINEADQILISKVTPEHLPSLLKRICSNLGDEAEQPFSVKEYIKSIDLLINETKKVNSDINIFDYLTDAKIPTEQLKELIELTQNDYEKYKLIFSVDELDQQLASTQVNDLNGNDYVRHLKDEVKQSLTNYKSKLEALIVENQSINNANLPIIYDAYKQLGKKPLNALAPQFIDLQLRTGQHTESNGEFYYDLIAMRISKLDQYGYPNPSTAILNSVDQRLADEVSKKIEFYISYGDLLLSKTKFNQPLVKKVVANLTSNRYGSSILSIERALNEFQDICDAFDLDPKELIIRLNGWSQYLNDLEFSRIKECIPDVNFFKYAVETDNDLTKFALNHLEKQFNEMTIEEWQDSLRDEYSYEFQLLLTIDAYKVKQNLIDAFIFVMKEIANGEHTVTYQDQLEELLSLIESKKPKIMSKLFLDLRDIFCKDAIISVQNFLLFIDWLFKYGKLEKNPESFRRIFNEDVLGSDECINKILNNHKEMSKILSSSADRGYFDDKITDLCTRNPDNEQLIAFAKTNSILINTHSENTNSE